jgi:DNA invertase Pin-like site-specific DNA recombinase
MTAAVAQFERGLISERIKDAKRNLGRAHKHQGGRRPFGYKFGGASGHGRARPLIPEPAEEAAIRGRSRISQVCRPCRATRGEPLHIRACKERRHASRR